ncbi:MAG: MBL fold metallo-hydrolase [Acholeplasmataceae bacterium]
MEIYVLASGSKGNLTYLKTKNEAVFIDVGIVYSKIVKKLDEYGEDINNIKALFLTHEHGDHVQGLKRLLSKNIIKDVFLTKGTFDCLSDEIVKLLPNYQIIKADEAFKYKNFEVMPIMLSHDANEPVGYIFNYKKKKVVIITDTGYVDESYHDILVDADLYLLEANHHPEKLLKSPRPYLLKQRILGVTGHLSNDDATYLLNKVIKNKKAIWVAAHISEDCNSIYDIEKSIVNNFDDPLKIEVYYSSQESLPVIKI